MNNKIRIKKEDSDTKKGKRHFGYGSQHGYLRMIYVTVILIKNILQIQKKILKTI